MWYLLPPANLSNLLHLFEPLSFHLFCIILSLVCSFLFIMIQFPMNGISAHIKEAPQSFWAPSTRWEHKKSEIWKEGLTWPCWHSDLRLLVSRTVRNTYISIVCKPPSLVYWYSSTNEWTHPVYMLLLECARLQSRRCILCTIFLFTTYSTLKKNEVSAYYEQDATHARSRTAIAPDSFFNEGINVWSQKDQTSFLHNN